MYQLNDKEIEKYWKDGFLYPIILFSEQEAFNLRLRLEEIEKIFPTTKIYLIQLINIKELIHNVLYL